MRLCREHFWQGYGRPEQTPGSRFRALVYQAYHASISWVGAVDRHDEQTVARAVAELRSVAEQL
jgi:hypothetical protein